MKKELLEYLIRECVKEVLEAFPQEPETVGAPAPPAAGQGTADQPPIPQSTSPEGAPLMPGVTGLFYVDPKKPTKPIKPVVQGGDPSTIERQLYHMAAKSVGPRVKVSSAALREASKVLANPAAVLFLYVGKQNPDDPDDELFLLPAKTLEQAQIGSVERNASAEHPTTQIQSPDPSGAVPQGKTMAPDIDENLREMLSAMIRESLQETRKG